jgi:hypothetical protein
VFKNDGDSIEQSSTKAKYPFKKGIRKMKELGENIEFADKRLTDVALTITDLLEKNLVTTYDAEKILWALLGSVYLYEVEEGKRTNMR